MSLGPLGRISEATTLGELALLRAQYGVVSIFTSFAFDENGAQTCKVMLVTQEHTAIGTSTDKGKNVPYIEALSDAFARIIHMVGAACTVAGAASGTSAKWAL